MTTSVFDSMLAAAAREGKLGKRSKESTDWLREKAKNTDRRQLGEQRFLGDATRSMNHVEVGRMYMFLYDPKLKATLPYYDRFPIIFPISKTKEGFMGINLHYLPPTLRAKLMDALHDIVSDSTYDRHTKLKLSYSVLTSAAKYRWFRPCIKQYLNSHVKSHFIQIFPNEWELAAFLPTQQFKKADARKVWTESRQMINK